MARPPSAANNVTTRGQAQASGVKHQMKPQWAGSTGVSTISRSRTRQLGAARENFLYGFKAAPPGPLAPPTRRTAVAWLRSPLRRRQRRSGWRESAEPKGSPLTYSSHPGFIETDPLPPCRDCSGSARTRQERLRRRLRRSSTLDRTCSKAPDHWQLSGQGQEWPGLTLSTATAVA
jgi:hypothetical protein